MPIDDEQRKREKEKVRNRSAEGYKDKLTDARADQISMELEAMAPPQITVPQCKVCMSERRLFIEKCLIDGMSFQAISNHLEQTGEYIDRRGISSHSKKHLKMGDAVTRAIMEHDAELQGQQFEEGVEGAFTLRGALNLLVRKGVKDALAGVTDIEVRDINQLIKQIREMEEGSGVQAQESAKLQVRLFMEAIQNVTNEWFDEEEAERFRGAIVTEIKRLRARDEIDVEVENSLKALPNAEL